MLTAPVEEELRSIARELQAKYNVPIEFVAADLERPGASEEIFREATAEGPIEILVNNAGLGQRGNFWEIPVHKDLTMIRVNVEAVVQLTKLFLPPMLERKRGRILNTASIAGFAPGPLLAVYHATKAFVLSLSESLATELEETNITVTALCPGATDTDFFPKAEMEQTRIFQKGNVMAPQEVAEKGYAAMMRGDRVFVPGGVNKTMVFTRRLTTESAQASMNQRLYEEVDEHKRDRGDVEADAKHN